MKWRASYRAGLVALSLWAVPAATFGQQERPRDDRTRTVEKLRERLGERSPQEIERLERHLQELQKLPREDRLVLLRRARKLREQERQLEPQLRDELEGLGPERARDVRRERLRDEFQKRGRALRERIPPHLREELEAAPPEKRRRMMRGLMQGRERMSRRAVERLGPRHGLTPGELERLRDLPPMERLEAVRRLKSRAGRNPQERFEGGGPDRRRPQQRRSEQRRRDSGAPQPRSRTRD